MARYQLRRPTPVRVYTRRVRRQASTAVAEGQEVVEEEEGEEENEEEGEGEELEGGLESPDSIASSSDEGGMSSSDDSDSEDEEEEPPLPTNGGAAPMSGWTAIQMPTTQGNVNVAITRNAAAPSTLSTIITARPVITQVPNSQGNNGALPQMTKMPFSTQKAFVSQSRGTFQAGTSLDGMPSGPAQSETRASESPQRSTQQQDAPIMTESAAIAATVLGVLGALALIVGVVILFKYRKRKQQRHQQRVTDNTFNPGNPDPLHIPETAHVAAKSAMFSRMRDGGVGVGHLTQSSGRSNTLFGAGSYIRPETVSTGCNNSRCPVDPPMPTPNPFADPPLNKAYDVLAGRPRSTTLTDCGSWVGNPFRNPESERFDPFGELKEKARQERVKFSQEARRETERGNVGSLEEKEKMDFVPQAPAR